ncbi:MAG: hypothetical protein COV85_03450 [Candidatus Portnoybacteria bacterium CG11_big_fil_rev_8_21_14_0_20_44_10]|nr:MAG: hypothetical protein COV85_03450 [Candidatus Portnoybacteria bacterium CG11_big_fil_rev_8_21_14_0_20_44_10]
MGEKNDILSTEVNEKARKIFIGDGEYKEFLEFLVDGLGNAYDTLSSKPEPTPETVANLFADFNAKLNEKLMSLTAEQGLTIAKEFSRKSHVEFFALVSAEQRAEAKNGGGPFLKWVFVYQNIIGILAPSPCSGCGGHGHDDHKCSGGCGGKCGESCTRKEDES